MSTTGTGLVLGVPALPAGGARQVKRHAPETMSKCARGVPKRGRHPEPESQGDTQTEFQIDPTVQGTLSAQA